MAELSDFRGHLQRAKEAVCDMWARRYDTDVDAIPDTSEGKPFGSPVAVDIGWLAVARSELHAAWHRLEAEAGFSERTGWMNGPPDGPGDYHLILEDQGGHPFCVVGCVMKRWEDGVDPRGPAIASLKGEIPRERADAEIEAMMRMDLLIPALNESLPVWSPLSSLWNCQAHRLIPEPKGHRWSP